jgi:predicted nucleotidyltransferase
MVDTLRFPTLLHAQAAETACEFFSPQAAVDTVLVVNSCARGQAVPESDLDMAVLLRDDVSKEEAAFLETAWQHEAAINAALRRYRESGPYAHMHLDLIHGQYVPIMWDEGGGPDAFEVEIGNQVAYAAPMHTAGPHYRQLQAHWLPYYTVELQRQRLKMVRSACLYDLDHISVFVGRGLYFQAFDCLYKSFQEFLQALFIAHQVYPLAYNKWIHMQVAEWLGLPELYQKLPGILSVSNIESDELVAKANDLKQLVDTWAGNQEFTQGCKG